MLEATCATTEQPSLEHFAIMTRSKQWSMKNYETSEWSQNNGIGRQKK